MKALQEFRQYQLSETADGRSIELARSEDEVVCLAFDVGRQFFVAMHVLAEDFEDRGTDQIAFHRRANDSKCIRHPNVAVVYEAGEDEGTPYFVTEFVGGEPLESYLARNAPLPESVALCIAGQLARGARALVDYPELLERCNLRMSRVTAYSPVLADLTVKLTDPGVASRGSGKGEAELCESLALVMLAATGAGQVKDLEGSRMKELLSTSSLGGTARRMISAISEGELITLDAFVRGIRRCVDDGAREPNSVLGAPLMPIGRLGAELRSAASIERVLGEDFKLDFNDPSGNEISGWSVVRESDGMCYRVFQLPPSRLCEASLLKRVEQAAGEGRHPHLRRVASVWPDSGGALFAERDDNFETLAAYCQRRGGLSGDELIWVSTELHAALDEANEFGYELWGFGLRALFLNGHGQNGILEDGTSCLSLRGHPTLEVLTEPGRFSNESIGPERAMVSPDDYDAFVSVIRCIPVIGGNPLMESAFNRFFLQQGEKGSSGISASKRRVEFIRQLREFLENNGLCDYFITSPSGSGGDDGEPYEAVGAVSIESPGVAQALFGGEDASSLEGWNPIAQSVAHGGDDEGAEIFRDSEPEGGWFWMVIFVLCAIGATLGMAAYFMGWL